MTLAFSLEDLHLVVDQHVLNSQMNKKSSHIDNTCCRVFCVRLLNEAQGSLLDDEQLVNTLQTSKKTSEEVTEQLQVSEQTEAKIDAAREVRAPLLTCTFYNITHPSENIYRNQSVKLYFVVGRGGLKSKLNLDIRRPKKHHFLAFFYAFQG